MIPHAVIMAILAALPADHSAVRACVARRADVIARDAGEAAARRGVPLPVLLAVGWLESRWGCDPRSGGSWGAPVDRWHRTVAGPRPVDAAASALALGYRRCSTDEGAVSHVRSGHCAPGRHARYVHAALALAARGGR